MKYFAAVIALVCCYSRNIQVNGSFNQCTKNYIKSCGECISIPGCAWCQDPRFARNPNVVMHRCNTPDQLLAKNCKRTSIYNPRSSKEVITDEKLTSIRDSASGKATQIKPQVIDLHLRPGDPVKIDLSFKRAEDYPVDLYYLLDISRSMEDDLTTLRDIGQRLGQKMRNITSNFRLGLGSFVDKPVKPYGFTDPERVANPCGPTISQTCVPAHSFRNVLPLTSKLDSFVHSLNNVTVSSNIDFPEGGFDAMMQTIVCQDEIGWRKQAYHLLVFSTDAIFHCAGDGRVGGIALPNDGNCHLNSDGEYTKATEMDYPSVGHLAAKISEHNILPVFVVDPLVIDAYKNLQKLIPISIVEELNDGSSNVITLIENAYRDLKSQVRLEVNAPRGITITDAKSQCRNVITDGLQCNELKSGSEVQFTFTLSSDGGLLESTSFTVSPTGYDEVVTINVTPMKECNCSVTDTTTSCTGHGKYECGACVCDDGFSGLDCSCNLNDNKGSFLNQQNCVHPISRKLCSNRGECLCGNCICKQYTNRLIDGQYCEHDEERCVSVQGKVCNGRGSCQNGSCLCDPGWTGVRCTCPLEEDPCYDRRPQALNDTVPCNGNGVCNCGVCRCNTVYNAAKFRGAFCEKQPAVKCNQLQDCIQCKFFGTGKYSDKEICSKLCKTYNVTKAYNDPFNNNQWTCRFRDQENRCRFEAYCEEVDGVLMVSVSPQQDCTSHSLVILGYGVLCAACLIAIEILVCLGLRSYKRTQESKNFTKYMKLYRSQKLQVETVSSQEYMSTDEV